jgi:predicted metal-binding protein
MLKDYNFALFMKFPVKADASEAVTRNLMRNIYDPDVSKELKKGAQDYYAQWCEDAKKILLTVLDLEQIAFNNGYPFAVGFMTGSCMLCDKCNVSAKVCMHPTMMRYPEHAVGINMMKTAERAGSSLKFPVKGRPEATGLLLID